MNSFRARFFHSRRLHALALSLAAAFTLAPFACAGTIVWSGGGGGTASEWLVPTNWTGSLAPGSADAATFGSAGSAATIGIDFGGATNNGANNQVVGSIVLDATSTINRTIGNSSTISAGILTINGVSGTLLSNQIAGRTLTLAPTANGGTQAMSISLASAGNINAVGDILISAAISGAGFTKAGAGMLTLTGANTYTGVTNVAGGKLVVSILANGGAASSIGASSNAAANLLINSGATLSYTGSGASTDRLFTMVGTATIDASGTGPINFTNTSSLGISGTAARTLILSGTGTGVNSIAALIGDNVGATSVSKNPGNTWALTNANTYTGSTLVSTGTLIVSSIQDGGVASNIGASTSDAANLRMGGGTLQYIGPATSTDRLFTLAGSNTTMDSSGTGPITFTNTGSIAISGAFTHQLALGGANTGANTLAAALGDGSFATSFTKSGSGTWVLTGANTYTGATTISAGTLQVGNGGTSGTLGSAAVSNSGSLIFNRADSPTVSNAISGTGSLTQAGAGTTILTGSNTYNGTTTISAGTLQVGNGGMTGTLGSGAIANNGSLVVNRSGAITISGAITGSGTFIQSGNGTTTLSGISNGWSLATVSAGVLRAGSASALGSGTASAMNVAAGGTLETNGFTVTGVGSLTGAGIVQNGSSAASSFNISGSASTSFGGVFQNGSTGTLSINKNGVGTLTLTGGSSTYTGSTFISGGVLSVATLANGGVASSIGASSNAATNLTLSSATLRYTGGAVSTDRLFGVAASTLPTLDASGAGAIQFTNTGALTFNSQTGARRLNLTGTNTGSNTLAALIGDNGGATAVTKSGAGIWALTGASTYTGVTSVTGGKLIISSLTNGGATSSIGSSTNAAANLVISGAGTLSYTGPATSTDRLFTLAAGGGFLESSGSGPITFTNTGSLGLSGTSARSLILSGTGPGTNTLAALIGDNVGATTVAKNPGNTWALTNANTYTGSTSISTGTLIVSSIQNGGVASNIGASTSAAANLRLGGGSLQYAGPTTSTDRLFTLSGSNATINSSGTGPINFTNTGSIDISGAFTHKLTLDGTNTGTNSLAAALGDGSLATSLAKSGAGHWTLTGANTYTGTTTINAGTLQVGDGGATGALGSGDIANNASLTVKRSDSITLSQAITGSGSFTQAGSGATQLTGNSNTYSGGTAVASGTLVAANSNPASSATGSGGVSVATGATLAGTGTVSGPVSFQNNASLIIGNSSGDVSAKQLRLLGQISQSASSTVNASFDLWSNGGSGTLNSPSASDSLDLGATDRSVALDLNLNLANPAGINNWTFGDAWQLIFWGGVSAANRNLVISAQNLPDISSYGLLWDTAGLSSSGVLTVTPEPSRALLAIAGLACLALRRRRR